MLRSYPQLRGCARARSDLHDIVAGQTHAAVFGRAGHHEVDQRDRLLGYWLQDLWCASGSVSKEGGRYVAEISDDGSTFVLLLEDAAPVALTSEVIVIDPAQGASCDQMIGFCFSGQHPLALIGG